MSGITAAATFTVTNTNDSGAGSFRQALLSANATAGTDTIAFNIPGAGVQTISPSSALPPITEQLVIDGYTQPGSSPNSNALNAGINAVPLIQLSGAAATLFVQADFSQIRGLVINGAIDSIRVAASNVVIAGNFIGTNATGTLSGVVFPGAAGAGVRHDGGNALTVGGAAAADRNLILGRTNAIVFTADASIGHVVQGNYIGTDVTGTSALGLLGLGANGIANVHDASIIGNLISGNEGNGLEVIGAATIASNLIGTQRNGTSALGNTEGIRVSAGGFGVLIGGTSAGNVIAFNRLRAIVVLPAAQTVRIAQNSIFNNSAGGSPTVAVSLGNSTLPLPNDVGDADAGANGGQNYPVISSAVFAAGNVTISGTLNSLASKTFRLEFFSNTACNPTFFGEGRTFLGSQDVTTDGSGNASFGPLVFAVPGGQTNVTSTATDIALSQTSEFSACVSGGAPPPGPTTTTLASSLNPSTFGQSVTFTATVSGASPTGTVQFRDGATVIGTSALVGTTATLTTSSLAVGTHPITAVYSGDADDATSTSAVVNQVVNPGAPGATSTSLVSSVNPSLLGQSVTFTATVTGTSPTGTVQFRDGATVIGTSALVGNTATFTTSALGVGTHPITAVYSGDADDAASTSPAVNQVVNAVTGPPAPPTADIPTLSEWMLMLLAACLAMLGVRRIRARRP